MTADGRRLGSNGGAACPAASPDPPRHLYWMIQMSMSRIPGMQPEMDPDREAIPICQLLQSCSYIQSIGTFCKRKNERPRGRQVGFPVGCRSMAFTAPG